MKLERARGRSTAQLRGTRWERDGGVRRLSALAVAASFGVALAIGCSGNGGLEGTGATSEALSTSLVISQVYGGGSATAPYANDFVELFNMGAAPVSLDGVSIQY